MSQSIFNWFYGRCVALVQGSPSPPCGPEQSMKYLAQLDSGTTIDDAHKLLVATAHAISQLLLINVEDVVGTGPHLLAVDTSFPLPYPSPDAYAPNLYAPRAFLSAALTKLSQNLPESLQTVLATHGFPQLSLSWPAQPNPDASLHTFVAFQEDCASKVQDIFYILSSKPKLTSILQLPSLFLLSSSSQPPSSSLLALTLHSLYFSHWLFAAILPLLMHKSASHTPLLAPLQSLLFSTSLSLASLSPLALSTHTHTEQQPLLYTRVLTALLPLAQAIAAPLGANNRPITSTATNTTHEDVHATNAVTVDPPYLSPGSASPLLPHLLSLRQHTHAFIAHYAAAPTCAPMHFPLSSLPMVRLTDTTNGNAAPTSLTSPHDHNVATGSASSPSPPPPAAAPLPSPPHLSPAASHTLLITTSTSAPPPHPHTHRRALATCITAIASLSPCLTTLAAQCLAAVAHDEEALTLLFSLPTSLLAIMKILLLRTLIYNERTQKPFCTPSVEPDRILLSELIIPAPEPSFPDFLPLHPPKNPHQAAMCVEKITEMTTQYDRITLSPAVSSLLGISPNFPTTYSEVPYSSAPTSLPLSSPLAFSFQAPPIPLYIADIVPLVLQVLPPVLDSDAQTHATPPSLPSSLTLLPLTGTNASHTTSNTTSDTTLCLATTSTSPSPLSPALTLVLIAFAHASAPVPLDKVLLPPRAHYPFHTHILGSHPFAAPPGTPTGIHTPTQTETQTHPSPACLQQWLLCLPSPLPLPPSLDKDNSTIAAENDWHPSHLPLVDELHDTHPETVAPISLALLCPDPVNDAGDGHACALPVDAHGRFRGETATDGWWVSRLVDAQAFLVRVLLLSMVADMREGANMGCGSGIASQLCTSMSDSAARATDSATMTDPTGIKTATTGVIAGSGSDTTTSLPLSSPLLLARYLLRRPIPETLALLESLPIHAPPPLAADMLRVSACYNTLALLRRALWVWEMEKGDEQVRRYFLGCLAQQGDADDATRGKNAVPVSYGNQYSGIASAHRDMGHNTSRTPAAGLPAQAHHALGAHAPHTHHGSEYWLLDEAYADASAPCI